MFVPFNGINMLFLNLPHNIQGKNKVNKKITQNCRRISFQVRLGSFSIILLSQKARIK